MSDNLTDRISDNDHLSELIRLVRGLDTRIGSLETRLESLETRIGSLETRFESLETRIESLEKKVDERLYDTRPIWENVQEQLSRYDDRFNNLEDRFNHLEDRFNHVQDQLNRLRADLEKGFRQIGQQMDMLAGNYVRLGASLRDIEDRLRL